MLVALAVLLAPSVVLAGEGAMPMPDHMVQMADKGDCGAHSSRSADRPVDKAPGKICCTGMSVAVAATPAAALLDEPVRAAPATVAVAAFYVDHSGDTATPPPRFA